MMFRTFIRDWWRENSKWPDGLEPHAGPIDYESGIIADTAAECVSWCREWNKTHPKGRYSRKAEFEEF